MVDYYKLLEVAQDADRIMIEQAIKKTRRLWNNRANSPDSSIRAEAEQHIREIAEAEKILYDSEKRDEYNRQLSQNPPIVETSSSPEVDENWEDEFFQAYDSNMCDYAAQIAQRVINSNERNGRAWFLYGEALRRCGDLSQAINSFQRAIMFSYDSDVVYRQMGITYYDAEAFSDALDSFEKAKKIDPKNAEYYSYMADVYRNMGRINEALSEASVAYGLSPNDNAVRFSYFASLYDAARSAMSYNRSSGKYLITNKVQLDYVNSLLKIMAMCIPQDDSKSNCMQAMDEIVERTVDAETPKGGIFKKPGYEYNFSISNQETRDSGRH